MAKTKFKKYQPSIIDISYHSAFITQNISKHHRQSRKKMAVMSITFAAKSNERFPWPGSATDDMHVAYVTSVASPLSLAASL